MSACEPPLSFLSLEVDCFLRFLYAYYPLTFFFINGCEICLDSDELFEFFVRLSIRRFG